MIKPLLILSSSIITWLLTSFALVSGYDIILPIPILIFSAAFSASQVGGTMLSRLIGYLRLLAYLMTGVAVLITPSLWDSKVNGDPFGMNYVVMKLVLIGSIGIGTIGYLIGQGIRIGRRSLGKRPG